MMVKPNRFFYRGKFFENESDFWKYVTEFQTGEAEQKDFDYAFDMLKKDIWMNLSIRQIKMTNEELAETVELIFTYALKKFFKKVK